VAALDHKALEGSWAHSHEEDNEDEMVLRPADRPFPPSRGRTFFDLQPDGNFVERSPGPDDRPVESRGRWSLRDGKLRLSPDGGGDREWEVAAAEPGRLALRKPR
jgi:hypothetical protein